VGPRFLFLFADAASSALASCFRGTHDADDAFDADGGADDDDDGGGGDDGGGEDEGMEGWPPHLLPPLQPTARLVRFLSSSSSSWAVVTGALVTVVVAVVVAAIAVAAASSATTATAPPSCSFCCCPFRCFCSFCCRLDAAVLAFTAAAEASNPRAIAHSSAIGKDDAAVGVGVGVIEVEVGRGLSSESTTK